MTDDEITAMANAAYSRRTPTQPARVSARERLLDGLNAALGTDTDLPVEDEVHGTQYRDRIVQAVERGLDAIEAAADIYALEQVSALLAQWSRGGRPSDGPRVSPGATGRQGGVNGDE